MAVRVGIIGVGWGSVVQVPAFRAVPQYEVVALCSRRPERVEEAGERLGIDDRSTDWRSFVARDDLDLISVCTPVDLHVEQTVTALEAGKHVLCEKPVAVTEADARVMRDAAEASGRAHAVCFENRFDPMRLAIWDLVREGFLGDPYYARIASTGDYWHPSRGLQSEWMYRVDEGGGYLLGMASHDIDFLHCLFGAPSSLCADVRTTVPRRTRPDGSVLEVDADDTSVLILRMANGLLATLATSVVGLGSNRRELELLGGDGSITIEGSIMGGEHDSTVRAVHVDGEGEVAVAASTRMPRSGVELPKRRAAGAIRSLALMLEDWLPAFDGEPTPGVPTLRDGWLVQAVVDAARRSAAGDGWVDIGAEGDADGMSAERAR
jgi:predicted dehydrogenase